jgi:choline dehydrogenase-like flavoprotein
MLGRGFSGNGDTLGFAYNCAVDDTNPERTPIYGIGAGNLWPKKPDSEATRPGPCITGIIDMRDAGDVKDGMVIEDGVLPSGLSLAYPPMFLFASALSAGQPRFVDEGARLKDAQVLAEGVQKGMEDPTPFTYGGSISRTQTFLVMSHEATATGGELLLEGDRLKITFPGVGELPVFARNDRVLQKASEAVRGNYVSNPLWSRSADRQLISVHPLGGCQMGQTGETGVVNDRCQVFSGSDSNTHEGLYVCDGSVIRGSLGVNPLLTISAISERAMELLAKEKHWVIDYGQRKASPERRVATPAEVAATPRSTLPPLAARTDWPEPKASDEVQRAKKSLLSKIGRALCALGPLITAIFARNWGRAFDIFNEHFCDISPGMRFSEQMRGPFSVKVQAGEEEGRYRISNPFELAARRGAADGDIMEAEFHVRVTSLHELINRPEHAAELTGTITLPTLAADRMSVKEGRLQLLIDDPTHVETWLMVYSGLVESGRRGPLRFEGRKTLRGRAGTHWWTDVTTLFVFMRDISGEKVIGRGILKLGLQDFVKQAQETRVAYSPDTTPARTGSWCRRTILCVLGRIPKALAALQLLSASKLASFFAERIVRAHGGILPYLQNYPAIANAERKQDIAGDPRSMRAPARPRRYEIQTEDHKTLALTRYEGGSKGPLIVAPGIGVTAASYAMNTVDVNFVEYFTRADYDVWLFDYRASPALPTSKERFTVDDIVENDWPAAVKFVREKTHAKDVQVLGHCVGSLSLLMALLDNLQGVRSAICSQFSLHPVTHWFNYAKIDMDVVGLLEGGLAKYLGTNLPIRREGVEGIVRALGKLLPGGLPRNLVEGFPYVDMRSHGTPDDERLDALLWDVPMPPEDHCKNPVCHRMFMVYGLALNHEHINEATHNALEDIFGPISSHLFNQLKLIMDLGRAVDKDGKDRYFEHPERLTMPITLLSGSRNRILMPESTERTLEWMCEANPENASKYSRHVFPAYAHMDLFIGKNADRDIFPFIKKTLDAYPRLSAKPDDATAVRVR